ncbi:MAG: glycosyltransferase [Ruminococcaceae bacterium]|nr:glycosyltransferase [Oscillospiraceae bacterium]
MFKLSVVVPVYKVEDYLEKCLDSVYPQLTDECEVVLVDDGSPDNCGAICDAYREKHPERTTVVHQENKGIGGARNAGVNAAKGEFLFFIDSDDTVNPGAIRTVLDAVDKYNADITVFPLNVVDKDGKLCEIMADDFECGKVFDPRNIDKCIVGTPAIWNKVVRSSLFTKTGISFPPRVWYEDIRTTPKLIASAESIVYMDTPLHNYLRRDGSIMNNATLHRNTEIIDALDDLISWFKEKELYETYREALDYLIIDHVYVSTLVRIIKSAGTKHPLMKTFADYAKKNCNSFNTGKNRFISEVMPKNRRIVYKLLRKKMYFAVNLIFKIKK